MRRAVFWSVVTLGIIIGVLSVLLWREHDALIELTRKSAEAEETTLLAQREAARLRGENQRLVEEVTKLSARREIAATESALQPPVSPDANALTPSTEILAQQRKEILNHFREITAARDQFVLENGRWPASVSELVGPDKMLRELKPVAGEDYGNLDFESGRFWIETRNGITVRYDAESGGYPLPGTEMAGKAVPPERRDLLFPPQSLRTSIEKAIDGFRTARAGQNPPQQDPSQLLPYFQTPKDAADYLEWLDARKAASR